MEKNGRWQEERYNEKKAGNIQGREIWEVVRKRKNRKAAVWKAKER